MFGSKTGSPLNPLNEDESFEDNEHSDPLNIENNRKTRKVL